MPKDCCCDDDAMHWPCGRAQFAPMRSQVPTPRTGTCFEADPLICDTAANRTFVMHTFIFYLWVCLSGPSKFNVSHLKFGMFMWLSPYHRS
ncbi:hypothetical protein BDR05DRAFT_207870 [Suillus weaverae]|nr:hypothetical protein BDR05DRAFT_207870 [Suillus weaverae]